MTRLTARTTRPRARSLLTQSGHGGCERSATTFRPTCSASIVLVDTPALDGQLHTHDGQSVTFALMAAAIWLAPSVRERPRSSAFIW